MKRPIAVALAFASFVLVVSTTTGWAQGITTGAFAGAVTDNDGDPLPGAVVNALHEPTGTRYSTVTRADGRYAIHNVRVGGPYKVTVTMTGFKTQTRDNVFVKLGETLELDFRLELASIEETKPHRATARMR